MSPLLLMAASGFAGLGYQIVWTQQGALWLGHESAAVLAVLAAFFGGQALGAWALGARIERSARPARWYAGCEFVIALWGAVLALAMAPVHGALLALTGAEPHPLWQWAVAFGGSFVLLLPATAAMGATLPAMRRWVQGQRGAAAVGPLYAANTAGAVAGVLGIALVLVPAVGLTKATALCVLLNLLCAAAVLARPAAGRPAPAARPTAQARPALARLAWTGFLGIGYEVLGVRVLAQVTEDTVYTFALVLAVYLAGTALGAALPRRSPGLGRWPLLLAAACALGGASLWGAEALRAALQPQGFAAALGVEALLAAAAFGLPTLAMGALFARLADAACAEGVDLGRVLAVNTLGAALAPPLVGVLLVPAFGAKPVLLGLALGYLLLVRPAGPLRGWWVPAAAAAAVAVLAPPLRFVDLPEGARLVRHDEGAMGAVSVVEDADGVSRLFINNRQQEGSSATAHVDGRQGLLPLLLHPAPRRALFLGLGTGVTASAATLDPGVQVDAVELLPEVIAASSLFTGGEVPRLARHAGDARRWVRASRAQWDVIVSDNFHPARSGSGALYTVEHFRAVRERLAQGGVFCQWLPLHQLDLQTLRPIVASFLAIYPQAFAIVASHSLQTPVIGLVAREGDRPFDARAVAGRQAALALDEHALDDPFAVLGSFVAGPASLAAWAAGAPPNTDDHPVVAYRAPRITYAPDSRPADRLLALLPAWRVDAAALAAGTDPAFAGRLAAYLRARDRYLLAGRDVRPSNDARRMVAQVGAPLLDVLRTSPDFRPAAEPLRRLAAALSRTDPEAGHALLAEVQRLSSDGHAPSLR